MPQIVDPQPEIVLEIDWGNFKLGMLMNQAYQRVTKAAGDQRAVSRVEMYFGDQVENWPIARMIWGQMVLSCPTESRPTDAEAAQWGELAKTMNMPIGFDKEGLMEVPSDAD